GHGAEEALCPGHKQCRHLEPPRVSQERLIVFPVLIERAIDFEARFHAPGACIMRCIAVNHFRFERTKVEGNPVEKVLNVDALSASRKGLRHVVSCVVPEEVSKIRVSQFACSEEGFERRGPGYDCINQDKLFYSGWIERSKRKCHR